MRSMTAPLRRVAMRRPDAMLSADPDLWHYAKPIDAPALVRQYDHLCELVEASGAEIVWMERADDGLADSVFTYDPSFVVPGGAIVLRPGKPLRAGEADLHRGFYREQGIPVLGAIEAPGLMEGGDCFWIDESTVAVGRGHRTNQEGIDQFTLLVDPLGITVEAYDLPYGAGPAACLHLLSLISPLDTDLALVHEPLLPTALHGRLVDAGYELLAAPPDEFEASAGLNLNVLATAPRRLIAIDGFPATASLLRAAGCDVSLFAADELCIPCEGGPTCLTLPLVRG